MKKLAKSLALVAVLGLLSFSTFAGQPPVGWSACNTGGRSYTVTQAPGDLATLAFSSQNVAFLTEAGAWDIRGHTLVATFFIATTGAPVYDGGYTGGCQVPANFRLYFTSTTGPYKLNNANRYPYSYWWSQEAWAYVADVDGGQIVTFFAPLSGVWTAANGQVNPTALQACAAATHQIGFSFGIGCFYDTGVSVSGGTSTMHLVSYTIQ